MDFHYTVISDKTLEQVVADLKAGLAEIKFGVLWELDVPAKLKEKGINFGVPFKIFEVCNPHRAKEALEANILVGYFLPCKIVVFEKDGKTNLGFVRPTVLVDMLEGNILKGFAEEVEKELVSVLDRVA